jgi:hypothetical protein
VLLSIERMTVLQGHNFCSFCRQKSRFWANQGIYVYSEGNKQICAWQRQICSFQERFSDFYLKRLGKCQNRTKWCDLFWLVPLGRPIHFKQICLDKGKSVYSMNVLAIYNRFCAWQRQICLKSRPRQKKRCQKW